MIFVLYDYRACAKLAVALLVSYEGINIGGAALKLEYVEAFKLRTARGNGKRGTAFHFGEDMSSNLVKSARANVLRRGRRFKMISQSKIQYNSAYATLRIPLAGAFGAYFGKGVFVCGFFYSYGKLAIAVGHG